LDGCPTNGAPRRRAAAAWPRNARGPTRSNHPPSAGVDDGSRLSARQRRRRCIPMTTNGLRRPQPPRPLPAGFLEFPRIVPPLLRVVPPALQACRGPPLPRGPPGPNRGLVDSWFICPPLLDSFVPLVFCVLELSSAMPPKRTTSYVLSKRARFGPFAGVGGLHHPAVRTGGLRTSRTYRPPGTTCARTAPCFAWADPAWPACPYNEQHLCFIVRPVVAGPRRWRGRPTSRRLKRGKWPDQRRARSQ